MRELVVHNESMALTSNLTVDSLTRAMRAHLYLAAAVAAERARELWDGEFEGKAPRTDDDIQAFIDALVTGFDDSMNDTIQAEAVLVRVRGLLGEFMTPADADAAIVSFREGPESHTDEVQRVRREWNAKNAKRARTIRVVWRTYWAGAVVLTAVVVGLAIASGNGEDVIAAAILAPSLLAIVAGIMAATFSSIRGEPSSPEPMPNM
ncbi:MULTISPECIES: hypothetical protein [Micrococcaceae]|uniref:hypothetical protein n=2 Tax=Micrococcales TaxID=85006 RepID=UPI001CFFEEC3|nr:MULTISPECIES: hypothetical protein [Micrococcaceae]MCB5281087.1 hypothetical protein [Arthrobacter sp. ES1]MDI3243223.1 hypothetical protein [Arthrobacter sp. AL05]WGZ80839.1 hypothetical protein QI450_06560 [Arthrobacter sp. EM1]